MNYSYLSATALAKNIDAGWETPDLHATPIAAIFSQYRKVFLQLTHPVLTDPVWLDLFPALDAVGMKNTSLSINDWLLWLGSRSLPTTAQAPSLRERTIKYRDGWDAGYQIKPTDHARAPDAELPRAEQVDLLLTKPGIDYPTEWKYLLGVVNGFVHRISGSANGFYIHRGGETGYIGNDNQVGLLSFKDVAEITTIPINADMIHKAKPDQKYGDYVYLTLPFDTANKTVFLVLGGYLHVLDGVYQMLSERLMRINFANFALAERIFHSVHQINLKSLGIEHPSWKPDQYAVSDLYSDKTILKYLTLPQSFLVVINRSNAFVRKQYLDIARLPGRYYGAAPNAFLPMVSELGQMVNYHPVEEDGRLVYAATPLQHQHYTSMSATWRDKLSLDDKSLSARPWEFSQAHLAQIGMFDV